MRVVVQRVLETSVKINKEVVASIQSGLLILVGICEEDTAEDVTYLCHKISKLRIFADDKGVMNKSIGDVHGEIIVVSQFTLYALTKKGNRPSYIKAAHPSLAIPLYELFKNTLATLLESEIQSGEFGADMQVSLINDGPVTILMDSKNKE